MPKLTSKWGRYPILDPKDTQDLEYGAAIHEFGNGLSRKDAETAAHKEYAQKHHSEAAAFHLRGMRAAQAAGDLDQSAKHGIIYGMHMDALGLDPLDKVPDSILKLVDADDKPRTYRFKAHKADGLFTDLLSGGSADNKPDSDFDPKSIEAGVKEEQSEHGGPPQISKELVKDHLTKDPDYYSDSN